MRLHDAELSELINRFKKELIEIAQKTEVLSNNEKVSVVIVNHNGRDYLKNVS